MASAPIAPTATFAAVTASSARASSSTIPARTSSATTFDGAALAVPDGSDAFPELERATRSTVTGTVVGTRTLPPCGDSMVPVSVSGPGVKPVPAVKAWTSTRVKSSGVGSPPMNCPSQAARTPPSALAAVGVVGVGGVGPLTTLTAVVPSGCCPMMARSFPSAVTLSAPSSTEE